MFKRMKLVLFAVVCMISSCTSLDTVSETQSFTGLNHEFGKSSHLDVVVIHGMGGFSMDDPAPIIGVAERTWGLRRVGIFVTKLIDPKDGVQIGGIQLFVYKGFYQGSERTVRFHQIYWNVLGKAIQNDYLAYDTAEKSGRYRSRWVNYVKSTFLNKDLADVVMYLGDYGSKVRRSLKMYLSGKTFEPYIGSRVKGSHGDYRIALISFSLGSKIFVDVLREMGLSGFATDRKIASNLINHLTRMYMLANQLPLLDLSSRSSRKPNADPCVLVLFFRENANSLGSSCKPINKDFRAIAISDPNDFFSYPIPQWMIKQSGNVFLNILVNNNKYGYFIPKMAGDITARIVRIEKEILPVGKEAYFVNHLGAHLGYGRNQRVLRYIFEGSE